jgi:hypothetical protein
MSNQDPAAVQLDGAVSIDLTEVHDLMLDELLVSAKRDGAGHE